MTKVFPNIRPKARGKKKLKFPQFKQTSDQSEKNHQALYYSKITKRIVPDEQTALTASAVEKDLITTVQKPDLIKKFISDICLVTSQIVLKTS